MKEELKQIIINSELTHFYISNYGRLFNKKNNSWFKGTIKGGYLTYSLRWKNKKYDKLAHRLVAEYFIPCDNMKNLVVNHKDGNKLNNNVNNLEFVTYSENNFHAINIGLKQKGNYLDKRLQYKNDIYGEIWKTYHDTVFSVSNKGRARNNKTNNLLKGKVNNKGYVEWCFCINGKKHTIFAHRAVFELFGCEEFDDNLVINHRDGNKTNNQIENLEQVSKSYNVYHSYYITQTNKNTKIVQKYSMSGELLDEYKSCNEAARLNEGCFPNLIINVCNGKCKSHHGYIWKYK